MTAQQIHEYVWNKVYENREKIAVVGGLDKAKASAVEELLREGNISPAARLMLKDNCNCVLCAIYRSCGECPLVRCSYDTDTLYGKSRCGYDHAIKKIRGIEVLNGHEDKKRLSMLES